MPGAPQLITDQIIEWVASTGKAIYHARVWRRQDGVHVVACGELDDNPGMSLINGSEQVWQALVDQYGANTIMLIFTCDPPGDDRRVQYTQVICKTINGKIRAGWLHMTDEYVADVLDGHIPDHPVTSDRPYSLASLRSAPARTANLIAVHGWTAPHQRGPAGKLAQQAYLQGRSPASLILHER